MPEPLLSVSNLSAFYGDTQVLWGVSLKVHPGQIVSVIGPNGAGKSTLLKAIVGLVKPRAKGPGPAVSLRRHPLDNLPTEEIIRRGVSLVPEGARVFPNLTCLDNLKLGAYLIQDPKLVAESLERVFGLFPRLQERLDQPAGTLSGGERQMLALGRALMSRPRVLLLDEPSLGLHPTVTARIFDTLQLLARQGLALLLVEQKVVQALRLCHNAYVLENGRVTRSGPGEELLSDPAIKKAYLAV